MSHRYQGWQLKGKPTTTQTLGYFPGKWEQRWTSDPTPSQIADAAIEIMTSEAHPAGIEWEWTMRPMDLREVNINFPKSLKKPLEVNDD
jgi:hypothetical protein